MVLLLRIAQWLTGIYFGVSVGVNAGGSNPALGVVVGIVVGIIVLLVLGLLVELYKWASEKLRDWQHYREYGR